MPGTLDKQAYGSGSTKTHVTAWFHDAAVHMYQALVREYTPAPRTIPPESHIPPESSTAVSPCGAEQRDIVDNGMRVTISDIEAPGDAMGNSGTVLRSASASSDGSGDTPIDTLNRDAALLALVAEALPTRVQHIVRRHHAHVKHYVDLSVLLCLTCFTHVCDDARVLFQRYCHLVDAGDRNNLDPALLHSGVVRLARSVHTLHRRWHRVAYKAQCGVEYRSTLSTLLGTLARLLQRKVEKWNTISIAHSTWDRFLVVRHDASTSVSAKMAFYVFFSCA